MNVPTRTPCVVCGASDWRPLPDPGPQSMASDWRVVAEPLARHRCAGCGLVRRWPGRAADATLYTSGYGLYAHAPGDARERARQQQYAAWIAESTPPSRAPARVLDVGCGNGSLLLALATHWPASRLAGCDPSAESVAHGAGSALRLWQGTAANLPVDAVSDVVVSVNVIEHTDDPLAFLVSLREAVAEGGVLVLVCPDGGRPNLELLFADHVHSFTPPHLRTLCGRAGLDVVAQGQAPPALGMFQMIVAMRGEPANDSGAIASGVDARASYLASWSELDARLLERVAAPAVCFGASEAAGLLRAYAPRTWQRVRACTVDGAVEGRFGPLPIVGLDRVDSSETVLVGVRPLDQARVAERLRTRFARVVTWYDLVHGGDGVE
jgi:SAM-dependent methyltransferase